MAGSLAGLGLAALAGALVLWLALLYRGAAYPGALQISDHTTYQFTPTLYIRRDTAYRTDDPFPDIYEWYSIKFQTGPEARATGSCNELDQSTTWLVVQRDVTITLCDTPEGRLMFVMRGVSLRRLYAPPARPAP